MFKFDKTLTNEEVQAVLPYLRAARANAAKDMTKGERVLAHDNSAVAHNVLSGFILRLTAHLDKIRAHLPRRGGHK